MPPRPSRAAAVALAVVLPQFAACRAAPTQTPTLGTAQRSPQPAATTGAVRGEVVASGLQSPWALAFLPDGRMLVTEKPGRLRLVSAAGQLSAPLGGVPAVWANGQGGLLDVAVDPQHAQNGTIYLSFSEPGPNGTAGTAVARARLAGNALTDVRVIYRQEPKVSAGQHFGSRIVVRRDGTLFVTQGDRGQDKARAFPQDLSNHIGKIVRIGVEGSVPADNPFVGRAGARPEIWSYGHRNVQAAALHPTTGQLWEIEHGARGGDELNAPEAGKNYGWPVITYGVDYNGSTIGEGTAKAGMEQPVYYWDPVIAPSGATFVTGNAYPGWDGSLVVGGLASRVLVRLVLQDGRVVREERHLADLGARIRDVQQGPDGLLYLVTDESNGRVVRVVPAR